METILSLTYLIGMLVTGLIWWKYTVGMGKKLDGGQILTTVAAVTMWPAFWLCFGLDYYLDKEG